MPARQQSQQQQAQPQAAAAADRLDRSGIQPVAPHIGFITEPPPGSNASPITRDPKFGRAPGVYPVRVFGTFALQPGETLGPAINLTYIPRGVILSDFFFVTNGVTGTLQDSLATPTIYGTVSGAVYTMAQMTGANANNLGTMYADTPRAISAEGCQVVQWQRGMTLQLFGAAGAQTWPTTTPLIFMIEWVPVYDSGV